jgi:hypothetical protein
MKKEQVKRKSVYKSLTEWKNAHLETFIYAKNRGILDEICESFGWRKPRKTDNADELITIKLTQEEFDIIVTSLNRHNFRSLEKSSEEELNALYKLGGKVCGTMIKAGIDTIQSDLLGQNLDDIYKLENK